jgi:hypothetical protein
MCYSRSMGRFFRPNQLSIALFILFLVFLITPLAVPSHFGFSMGFFGESQKYHAVLNRGFGHVFMLWDDVAFFSAFGPWLFSGLWSLTGSFDLGTRSGVLGILLMLIGPFLYYILSCRISYLVKSDRTRQWIISGVSTLVIVLPLSFYSYSRTVAREISYLGTIENCTIRCVFPAQQQLEPSIDTCRAQCNAKQWPSNDQRISCWNHCGDPLEAARAQCENSCKSTPQ